MDLFSPLKENSKSLLFNSLIKGRSLGNLSYFWSCSFSQRWRFRKICSNVSRDIESDTACNKVSGSVSQYILRFGSLWNPLSIIIIIIIITIIIIIIIIINIIIIIIITIWNNNTNLKSYL